MNSDPFLVKEYMQESDIVSFASVLGPALKAGDLIALVGDLGAGKTTLARALVRICVGVKDAEVPSPTFNLVQDYEHTNGTQIIHTDLYRLEHSEDVYDLGIDDIRLDVILIVEWPDRMPIDWQENCLLVQITDSGTAARKLTFGGSKQWQDRFRHLGLL